MPIKRTPSSGKRIIREGVGCNNNDNLVNMRPSPPPPPPTSNQSKK